MTSNSEAPPPEEQSLLWLVSLAGPISLQPPISFISVEIQNKKKQNISLDAK